MPTVTAWFTTALALSTTAGGRSSKRTAATNSPSRTASGVVSTEPAMESVQNDEAAGRAVENGAATCRHQHGVAERDAAPADFQVRDLDAEHLARLQRRGLARVQLRSLVGLETDGVADVAALKIGEPGGTRRRHHGLVDVPGGRARLHRVTARLESGLHGLRRRQLARARLAHHRRPAETAVIALVNGADV